MTTWTKTSSTPKLDIIVTSLHLIASDMSSLCINQEKSKSDLVVIISMYHAPCPSTVHSKVITTPFPHSFMSQYLLAEHTETNSMYYNCILDAVLTYRNCVDLQDQKCHLKPSIIILCPSISQWVHSISLIHIRQPDSGCSETKVELKETQCLIFFQKCGSLFILAVYIRILHLPNCTLQSHICHGHPFGHVPRYFL